MSFWDAWTACVTFTESVSAVILQSAALMRAGCGGERRVRPAEAIKVRLLGGKGLLEGPWRRVRRGVPSERVQRRRRVPKMCALPELLAVSCAANGLHSGSRCCQQRHGQAVVSSRCGHTMTAHACTLVFHSYIER
jgi:hypothetical protein